MAHYQVTVSWQERQALLLALRIDIRQQITAAAGPGPGPGMPASAWAAEHMRGAEQSAVLYRRLLRASATH